MKFLAVSEYSHLYLSHSLYWDSPGPGQYLIHPVSALPPIGPSPVKFLCRPWLNEWNPVTGRKDLNTWSLCKPHVWTVLVGAGEGSTFVTGDSPSPQGHSRAAWPSSSSTALSRRNVYREIQGSTNCQFAVLQKGASRLFISRASMWQCFQTNVTSFKKVRNLLVFLHLLLFKTNSFIHKYMWHAWGKKRATLHLRTRQLDGQAIPGKSSLPKLPSRAADFSFENCT